VTRTPERQDNTTRSGPPPFPFRPPAPTEAIPASTNPRRDPTPGA
jgi:hypothetical protein